PSISTYSPCCVISTPIFLKQWIVWMQSSPGRNLSITVFPFAIDPIMTARWEMDLSSGTVIVPTKPFRFFFTYCTVKYFLPLKPIHMFRNYFVLVKFGRVFDLFHFENSIAKHLTTLRALPLYEGS